MFLTALNNFQSASFKRAFAVAFVFATLSSSLFWLDFFRGSRGEMTVLFISKTEESAGELAENAAELTGMLSFYERVLEDDDLINDSFVGYSPDERKTLWNKVISVKREGKSGVLTLRVVEDTPEKAKRLIRQVTQTLFTTMSFYYNIKTEADMRVIDGPFVSYALTSPILYVTASVLTGLFVTLVFFFGLSMAPKFFVGRKKKFTQIDVSHLAKFIEGETVPWIDPRKFMPVKPSALSFENTSKEKSPQYIAHAPAPANLPVAPAEIGVASGEGEESATMFLENGIVSSDQNPDSVPGDEYSEPTSEEYKRRLNELLSGL